MASKLPINPEVTSTRLVGDSGIPQLGRTNPTTTNLPLGMFDNYGGLQAAIQSKGAQIQRNDTRIQQVKKILSDEYDSLMRVNATNALIDINAKQLVASDEFLKKNPSGDGYAKAMAQSYQQSIENAVSNAPDQRTARLISAQAKVTMLDGVETAMKREKHIKSEYVIANTEKNRQILLQQVMNDPHNANAIKLQYESALLATREFIPDKFASYQQQAMEEFSHAAIVGLIESNPGGALKKLQKETVPGLDVKDKLQLMHYAEHKVKEGEEKAKRAQHIAEQAKEDAQILTSWQLKNLIASGTGSEAMIDAADLTPLQKLKLKHELIIANKANEEKVTAVDKFIGKVAKGEAIIGEEDDVANQAYLRMVDNASEEAKAAGESPKLSCIEKAQIALNMNSDNNVKSLCSDLRNAIQHGSSEDGMDAAMAIKMVQEQNPDIIDKYIDSRDKAYASYMTNNGFLQEKYPDKLKAKHQKALEMLYKNPTKAILEEREHRYKEFLVVNQNHVDHIDRIVRNVIPSSFLGGISKDNWDPVNISRISVDAKEIAREKIMLGMDNPTDVEDAVEAELKTMWGTTRINAKKTGSDLLKRFSDVAGVNPDVSLVAVKLGTGWDEESFMKYPPELMYPQLSIQELHKQANNIIQKAAKLNQDVLGKDTQIKTGKPGTNIIQALIDGEWTDVRVFVDSTSDKKNYSFYYLESDDNVLTRRILTNPRTGIPIRFRFGPPKQKEAEKNANK
jgi:hypothetical protein